MVKTNLGILYVKYFTKSGRIRIKKAKSFNANINNNDIELSLISFYRKNRKKVKEKVKVGERTKLFIH